MADALTQNQTFATPSEAMAHYGVKGMRWGVRKKEDKSGGTDRAQDPPTRRQQKRAGISADLRARAAKADVAATEWRQEADATRPGVMGAYERKVYNDQAKSNERYSTKLNKQADNVDAGKMTPTQKRLLIGGAIVGTLALGITYQNMQQSGQLNSLRLQGEAYIRGTPGQFFKRNDALKHAKTPDEVQALVVPGLNPGYRTQGGSMNCRRCTFAYELRRRGYDVDATTSEIGYGQSESGLLNALSPGSRNHYRMTSLSRQVVTGGGIRAVAPGDRRQNLGERFSAKKATDHADVLETFRKMPDGARGEAVFNFGAFGHSLAFERFGDKTFIFDTQKGQRYSVDDPKEYGSFLEKWGIANVKDIQMTRLDNVELDTKFLSRWATNREGGTRVPSAAERQAQRKSEAESKAQANRAQQQAMLQVIQGRPAGMHITEWNRIQRKAGL